MFTRLIFASLLALSLSQCTSSQLKRIENPTELIELESENSKPISLYVHPYQGSPVIGHQYLLIALPFGRIVTDQIHLDLENELAKELILRGYKRNFEGRSQLEVKVLAVQTTAYDLILTRYLKSLVTLQIDFKHKSGREESFSVSGTYSRFRAFGFSTELTQSYHKAINDVVKKVIERLML